MKKIIGSAAVLSALVFLSGCGPSTTKQSNSPTSAPASPSAPVQMPGQNPTTPPAPSQDQSLPTTSANAVMIQNFAFSPGTLAVKKGTTVTWTNNDSAPHQIKSATFNSSQLSKGQTFSFTFNDMGTFDYSCAIHPSMLGKIVVQ